jgi:hypothetical protein
MKFLVMQFLPLSRHLMSPLSEHHPQHPVLTHPQFQIDTETHLCFHVEHPPRGTRKDYWWESQRERDHQEDQDVGGVDNIRMDLGEVGWGDVNWIGLVQDRNRWRALVNSVLNLRVP